MESGICRVCGCTEHSPCYHPTYGYCWWADESHTICSHCAEKIIAEDPETKHDINRQRREGIPEDAECYMCGNFGENDDGEFCGVTGEPVMCCDPACEDFDDCR